MQQLHPVDQIRQSVAHSLWNAVSATQNDILVNLCYDKDKRYRLLKENFAKNFSGKVYLSEHSCYENVKLPFKFILHNFINNHKVDDWSIVVLQNNTINYKDNSDLYHAIRKNSPNSIFVCWDYDNHHWVVLSTMVAALVDIYIPAHTENVNAITRFNNNSFGPVACGTLQWTKEFAKKNIKLIKNTKRSDEPLGHHFEYSHFTYRNGCVRAVNRVYKEVALVPPKYHERPPIERLKEWTHHKAHWIMPVFNDIPLRFFDALFTGGIPIIPKTLQGNPIIQGLDDFCEFYTIQDLVEPKEITNRAIAKFDKLGDKGTMARHQAILNAHHIDNRFELIFKHIEKEFNLSLDTDAK